MQIEHNEQVKLNAINPNKRKRSATVFAEVKSIGKLSSLEIERMYTIFSKYYVNHNRNQFTLDLSEKDHVILLRDTKENTIQGFSTLLRVDLKPYGFNSLGIYSGDTVLEKEYWGNKALGVAFLKYLWSEKAKNPLRPVYWFLISKGYKTYLLMANNFKTHFPRHDVATPNKFKALMDSFYGKRFPKHYKANLGTIEFDSQACCLKESVAEISKVLFENKKIQFFANKNSQWSKGDELACVAEMTLIMPLQYLIKKTIFKRRSQ